MRFTSTRIALAIAGSALLMSSPLAQADDYFPLNNLTVYGGHLYVADPTQDVQISFVIDKGITNDYNALYVWNDVAGTWDNVFVGETYKSLKKGGYTITLSPDQYSTGEVLFKFIAADNLSDYNKGKDTWTYYGDTSLNTDGLAHMAVNYDYKGTLSKILCGYQPVTPSGDNVALVGFEDYYNYNKNACTKLHKDFDDLVIFVTNVQASPAPEPETYAMLLAGLGVVGLVARRRRKQV
ncbi:MAG: PEP-CTERM sorting domain-containing protein [Azoarcus sp.]|jgi:hypothetical protein|nr:PEP-CTERM sorting domain-containing protein [Azoarcus sp.]